MAKFIEHCSICKVSLADHPGVRPCVGGTWKKPESYTQSVKPRVKPTPAKPEPPKPRPRPRTPSVFMVYLDGEPVRARGIKGMTAAAAAERFWLAEVFAGNVKARVIGRVIVQHPRGPEVDPTAEWKESDSGHLAMFLVSAHAVQHTDVEKK